MRQRPLSILGRGRINLLSPGLNQISHLHHMSSRRGGRGGRGGGGGPQNKEKRPPLTHFLCLPLVNTTSLPQLVSSLAEFKEVIPLNSPQTNTLKPQTKLIPDDALRPVGTLHFTLGVMSLTTEERVQEALKFLQNLDITSIMQDVESELSSQGMKRSETSLDSLNISLTSLHALPRAREATILHAAPSDPTLRLYPFSDRLRNKFIEAGFILAETETKRDDKDSKGPTEPENENIAGSSKAEEQEEEPPAPQNQKGKTRRPRPLLLHATVANTIYMGRRRQPGSWKKDTYKFDARDLISRFRNYYDADEGTSAQKEGQNEEKPFIWAKNFPLDKVCICEMGAKDIPEEDVERRFLGQEYRAVGERKLEFARVTDS